MPAALNIDPWRCPLTVMARPRAGHPKRPNGSQSAAPGGPVKPHRRQLRRHPKLIESADCCLFVMARPGRTGVNLMRCRRKPFSFNVMARLDRATRRGTVPRRVARSSRAMTEGERPAHQNLLRHCPKLTPVRLDRATRSGTVPRRVARSSRAMTLKENGFLRHCAKLTPVRSARAMTIGDRRSVERINFVRHPREPPAHICRPRHQNSISSSSICSGSLCAAAHHSRRSGQARTWAQ